MLLQGSDFLNGAVLEGYGISAHMRPDRYRSNQNNMDKQNQYAGHIAECKVLIVKGKEVYERIKVKLPTGIT
jgi:hypothetical protein